MSFYLYMKEPPKDRDNFFYWEGSPPPRYNNVMTWWVEPKKDGTGTAVKYGTGNLGRKGVHWEGDFTVGRWHQLGMHIHWSEDPAKGNVKLWWDGVVVLDKKVQTKGPQTVYFCQPGIHRAPHAKSVDTIYFDDFLCATTLEEIQIQKPDEGQANGGRPTTPRPTMLAPCVGRHHRGVEPGRSSPRTGPTPGPRPEWHALPCARRAVAAVRGPSQEPRDTDPLPVGSVTRVDGNPMGGRAPTLREGVPPSTWRLDPRSSGSDIDQTRPENDPGRVRQVTVHPLQGSRPVERHLDGSGMGLA